jgi:hypothetical protein
VAVAEVVMVETQLAELVVLVVLVVVVLAELEIA